MEEGLENTKKKPRESRKPEPRVPLDKLMKSGHYKKHDTPGTDTYDDGLDEKGVLRMAGSTSTGAAPNYMEHKGPNDLRIRPRARREEAAVQGGLRIVDAKELSSDIDKNDAAAKWLKKNDPKEKD